MTGKARYVEPKIIYVLRWQKFGKLKQKEFSSIHTAIAQLKKFLDDVDGKNYPGIRVIAGQFKDEIPEVEALLGGRRVSDGSYPKRYQIKWLIKKKGGSRRVYGTLEEAKTQHRARWTILAQEKDSYLYSAIYVRIS